MTLPARPNLPPPREERFATLEELQALSHPVRWRILRLCLDEPLTNQQLAERLDLAPATVLRHVRSLVATGFLAAEAVRTGQHGALERPYRATGRTFGLQVGFDDSEPHLAQRVDLALIAAHRAEFVEAGPHASRDLARGTLRLGAESLVELRRRLGELLAEFMGREEEDGEALSYLWSVIAREQGGAEAPRES